MRGQNNVIQVARECDAVLRKEQRTASHELPSNRQQLADATVLYGTVGTSHKHHVGRVRDTHLYSRSASCSFPSACSNPASDATLVRVLGWYGPRTRSLASSARLHSNRGEGVWRQVWKKCEHNRAL